MDFIRRAWTFLSTNKWKIVGGIALFTGGSILLSGTAQGTKGNTKLLSSENRAELLAKCRLACVSGSHCWIDALRQKIDTLCNYGDIVEQMRSPDVSKEQKAQLLKELLPRCTAPNVDTC